MPPRARGTILTVCAVLFGLLAVSNLLKPLELGGTTGFVLLGRRLSGTANLVVAPVFAAFLAFYAVSIWRMRRAALPLAYTYALYVLLNLVLFNVRTPQPSDGPSLAFSLVYVSVALGVSWGAAALLHRRRAELA